MKMMKITLMFVVVAAMCSSSVFGATTIWDGATDNTWSGDNWNKYTDPITRVAPIAGDYVVIGGAGGVVLDVAGFGSDLQLGASGIASLDIQNDLTITGSAWAGMYAGGNGTINLNTASTITVTYFTIGFDTGATGVVNMSDGTFDAPGNFIVAGHNAAVATLNMSGGAINTPYLGIGNGVGSTANVDLFGGTISTGNFFIGTAAGGQGDGTLALDGDGKMIIDNSIQTAAAWLGTFDYYVSTSQILNAQANIVGDTLEITAIPEPATMLLLGLGGVLLRRKR